MLLALRFAVKTNGSPFLVDAQDWIIGKGLVVGIFQKARLRQAVKLVDTQAVVQRQFGRDIVFGTQVNGAFGGKLILQLFDVKSRGGG